MEILLSKSTLMNALLFNKVCIKKENTKEANEYNEKLKVNRLLTISRLDVTIIKDTEDFVS